MKIILFILIILIVSTLVLWFGLQMKPQPFPSIQSAMFDSETLPLPENLPKPVELFYNRIYGKLVPLIKTAIISGRGTMRVNGITFPVRFRFIHQTGQSYRHYIEATIFGLPLMKINETYLEGNGRMELPFGVSEGYKIDQGANLALWAEAVWMPSLWITNPDARWAPIDDHTAYLFVPFDAEEERFIIRFDPETGMLRTMESMRFKGEESNEKILWLNEVLEWDTLDGRLAPIVTAITWQDEESPWAILSVEELIYNEDVQTYIHAE